MDKLTKIANKIKINLPTKNSKLSKIARKVAQFLEDNPYTIEIATMVEGFLEKNKQVLLLNSGLSGLDTYVSPSDVEITVESKGSGFQIDVMLPELNVSNSEMLMNDLSKNIYGLLESNREFKDYNFTVFVKA
jgi:hypothetical protein